MTDSRNTFPPGSERPAEATSDRLIFPAHSPRRVQLVLVALALVVAIGVIDFHLGYELSLQVFYIVPVCLAVGAGWQFGAAVAVLSVASTLIGDTIAGARFAATYVPLGNAGFALGTYLAVVWLFQSVLTSQRELEETVQQRTLALRRVLAERERLEVALLESGERERRSIGHDLHDGLGQHLTGTALAGQVIVEKLQARQLVEEETDVKKLVGHIEEAIEMTRRLAKGLLLAEIPPAALLGALQELAEDVGGEHRVRCVFWREGQVRIRDTAAATHLFHIAKEAVHNALHHGRATRIEILLTATAGGSALTIRDNGSGLPPPAGRGQGLGLRIMAHRAEIIGWSFNVAAAPDGGTVVSCTSVQA